MHETGRLGHEIGPELLALQNVDLPEPPALDWKESRRTNGGQNVHHTGLQQTYFTCLKQ